METTNTGGLAFMFPGQGSQKKGMGKDLFDQVPEFINAEQQINDILGYSLRNLCIEDPDNKLQQTQYTQPCLYIVNALHYFKVKAEGKAPSVFIGHSLGEYNALMAAGAFDLLTGLKLVQKRGELMSSVNNGSMTAVIGLAPEIIERVIQTSGIKGVAVANYNSPSQTVISGVSDGIRDLSPLLSEAGAQVCIPLPVSTAFHSSLMEDAASDFEEFLGDFQFQPLQVPVIANTTALPYPAGDSSSVIRWFLTQQICESVQWQQSITFLLQQGIAQFHEIGPGTVLTRLVEQIQADRKEVV